MFCQGDGSDSRRHEGTGLGLYLVRRFVAQFGGTVELDSTPGRGSVFAVRLPCAGTRNPPSSAAKTREDEPRDRARSTA